MVCVPVQAVRTPRVVCLRVHIEECVNSTACTIACAEMDRVAECACKVAIFRADSVS